MTAVPYHVSESAQCPNSKPWAVIKEADGSVVGCHETQDSAHDQLAALYASEPEARGAGQWQALYGSMDRPEEWIVVTGPWGYVPPDVIGVLRYLGEPVELLRQLYRYRLSLARSADALEIVTGHLAAELHISRAELGSMVRSADLLILPSIGWIGLAQACLFGIGTPAWQIAEGRA